MNKEEIYLYVMMTMALSSGIKLPYSLRKPDKNSHKCLLHSCTNTTNHNGGYCCAEHCKRHRIVTLKLKKIGLRKAGDRFIVDWNLVK